MKTRNSKLQKTEFSSLTSLIVLLAVILVLNAKVNATERTTIIKAEIEAYADILLAEHDEDISIESWMLNENYFFHNVALEAVHEASLEMESWMSEVELFAAANYVEAETEEALNVAEWTMNENNFFPALYLESEMEYELKMESWMIDAKGFSSAYSLNAEAEEDLNVEEWMLNDNTFLPAFILEAETENALGLESWMVSDSIFNSVPAAPVKPETLAMNQEKNEKVTTIEYKDTKTGQIFLFQLAEVEEPKMKLERWMVDKKFWNRNQKSE